MSSFTNGAGRKTKFEGDCVPPGTEFGASVSSGNKMKPGSTTKGRKNEELFTGSASDVKPDVSMEDLEAKKGMDVCEPRKKRRRQYKTLRRRFINPLTVKGRLLYATTTRPDSLNENSKDAEHSNSSVRSDHFLTIFNLPESWNEEEIKEFIEKEFEVVSNIEMLFDKDDQFIGAIQLEFDSSDQCKLAKSVLMGKEVEGKRLEAYDSEDESDSDVDSTEPQAKRRNEGRWRPDVDIWEKDPKGLYGLKPEYLKVMGIKPPVDRWVHVTNFGSTKAELRELMELAGEVMVCSVVSGQQKYAKVMYSHPLEAVQAVSMLHNRQYQGAALKVVMDTCPTHSSYLLPNGLLNVGPGLGSNGSPLRDIVRHYERFVKGFHSSLNPALFHEPDESAPASVTIDANFRKMKQEIPQPLTNKFVPRNVQQSGSQASPPISAKNQFRQSVPQFNQRPQSIPVVFGPQFPGPVGPRNGPGPMCAPSMPCQVRPMPGPPGPMGPPMRPMSGPTSRPTGPMTGPPLRPIGPNGPNTEHAGPKPMSGPGSKGPNNEPSRPWPGAPSPIEHVTIELQNLPLNTTFPLLSEKMGECGPVMSLQLTAPGCAVVQYSHKSFADRCFQQYNNACVLGNIIKVSYL